MGFSYTEEKKMTSPINMHSYMMRRIERVVCEELGVLRTENVSG